MNTIVIFLTDTPWYVYLILAYLIFVGVKAVKGGTVSIKKLFILPAVFVWMSINELVDSSIHVSFLHIVIWLIGAAIGAYLLGWVPYSHLEIAADKDKKLLNVSGSWFTLILIMMTFVIKYAIAVILSMNHSLSLGSIYGLLLVSGIFTGAFIGRLLYGLYKLQTGPYVNL